MHAYGRIKWSIKFSPMYSMHSQAQDAFRFALRNSLPERSLFVQCEDVPVFLPPAENREPVWLLRPSDRRQMTHAGYDQRYLQPATAFAGGGGFRPLRCEQRNGRLRAVERQVQAAEHDTPHLYVRFHVAVGRCESEKAGPHADQRHLCR